MPGRPARTRHRATARPRVLPDRGAPFRRDAGIGLVPAPLEFSSTGRRGRPAGRPLPSCRGPLPQLGPAPRGGNPRPVSGPAACVNASSAPAAPEAMCARRVDAIPSVVPGRAISRSGRRPSPSAGEDACARSRDGGDERDADHPDAREAGPANGTGLSPHQHGIWEGVPPGGFEPPPLPPEGSALSPELWGPGCARARIQGSTGDEARRAVATGRERRRIPPPEETPRSGTGAARQDGRRTTAAPPGHGGPPIPSRGDHL